MKNKLQQMTAEIAGQREEVINKLVQFSLTDLLLFWGQEKELLLRQEEQWAPLLSWAKEEFDTKFLETKGLDVPEENKASGYRLKNFMESLSDKELTAFYAAALDMRSVLLAAALVKGRISAEQAYQAAFLEELWQAENWGIEPEAEQRRQEIKAELYAIEDFLKS